MKNSKKGAIGIILIVVIILAVIGFSSYNYLSKNNPEIMLGNEDSKVREAGKEVLIALRDGDYERLEGLVSTDGLSWNEYPNLDLTKTDLAKTEISKIPMDTKKYMFGYTDGKGDEIILTRPEYIKKYIYNHDYLTAKQIAINQKLGSGNSANTLMEDRGNRTLVAYHFDGFDPKYTGMDWTTLYLVFDIEGGQYKLRGIAKDNWTI